jgi:hypothetical protein
MTLREEAGLMRSLGAIEAMNLDGGGSSTMVLRGRVVNEPVGGRERGVTSSILVVPGRPPAEPGDVRPARAAPAASGGAWAAASRDPGSTGGLLRGIIHGAFGRPPHGVSAVLRRLLGLQPPR